VSQDEQILAELRLIRQSMHRPQMRHGWLKLFVHDLEYNPQTQYKVHFYAAIYWLINFPIILILFFAFPDIWLQVGLLVTLVYSIYANLATDYGAMSAAEAATGSGPLPEIPVEGHVRASE
jgi:hypothetical protein